MRCNKRSNTTNKNEIHQLAPFNRCDSSHNHQCLFLLYTVSFRLWFVWFDFLLLALCGPHDTKTVSDGNLKPFSFHSWDFYLLFHLRLRLWLSHLSDSDFGWVFICILSAARFPNRNVLYIYFCCVPVLLNSNSCSIFERYAEYSIGVCMAKGNATAKATVSFSFFFCLFCKWQHRFFSFVV